MTLDTKRGAREGLEFGILAGVIFAIMEMAGAVAMGHPALMPLKMFASVVLGKAALAPTAGSSVLLVGIIAHLALSGTFGVVYGLVNERFSVDTQTRFGRQTGVGLIAGALLWLGNFQILGRLLYPWFLRQPQLPALVMHAVFFGLPLGLFYAAAERKTRHVGGRAVAHA
jgi:hypothetical protein